jgi:hypothetical protein
MNIPTFDTVKEQAEQLSYSDKMILIEMLYQSTNVHSTDTTLPRGTKLRVAGLHAGKGWMAEDFDEPLPDDHFFFNAK